MGKVKRDKYSKHEIVLQSNPIFVQIFSLVSLAILTLQILRGNNKTEGVDKLIFGLSVLIGLYYFLRASFFKKMPLPSTLLVILSLISVAIGIIGVEKHPTMSPNFLSTLWLGFGLVVFLITVMLLPFIFSIYKVQSPKTTMRILSTILALVVVILVIPAVWQGGNSLIDPYHSEFVVNELLAVPAGNLPYINFIPQYGILYSWLIAPLQGFLSPDGLVTLGLYVMSLGAIIALAIGVVLVYRAQGSKSVSLSVLLVVPFTSLAQFPGREKYAGTIYDLLSALPGRILFGMIIGWLTIKILSGGIRSRAWYIISGFISGLSLWINQDFAFAAGLLSFVAVIIFVRHSAMKLLFAFTYFAGLIFYPLALFVTGNRIRFDSIGFFILQYTSGFMAEPIQTPGPVLIILPLIVSICFSSTVPLFIERFKKTELPQEQRRALLTASFFSTWSLIGFSYYLNRSYASGQMQILFLPLAVAMASFFHYLMLLNQGRLPWSGKTFFLPSTWKGDRYKTNVSFLAIAIMMALPIATIIAFPNPKIEIDRLTNAPRDHKWPLANVESAISRIRILKTDISKQDIGYLGNAGNYVQLVTDIKSVNILNSPMDIPPAQAAIKIGCSYIDTSARKYLAIDQLAKQLQEAFGSKKVCDVYGISIKVPTISPYLLEKSKG